MNAKIARLGLLYLVQGMPLGLLFGIVPILMIERGETNIAIANTSILLAPWGLKFLWAPVVDSVHSPRIGRRRSWILPLQAIVALVFAALAFMSTEGSFVPLFAGIFVLNLATATMDVAVDGLAVDWLSDDELGPGNAAQVGGFKIGMLFVSGVAVQLLRIGPWSWVFGAMAVVATLAFLATLTFREPTFLAFRPAERVTASDFFRLLWKLVVDPPMRWLVLVVLLYKAGEAMADSQWKLFLSVARFSAQDIALYSGLCGMLASTLGSLVGGAIGMRSRSLVFALFAVAAFRVLPLAAETIVTAVHPGREIVVTALLFENFAGGVLTTLVTALMMSSADPARAGTSFTILATVDSFGKAVPTYLAGVVAHFAGYTVVFVLATILSCAFLALYRPLRRHEDAGAYRRAKLVSATASGEPPT